MIIAKIQCAKASDDYLEVVRHENGLTQTTSYGYPLLSKKNCRILAELVVADDEEFKRLIGVYDIKLEKEW